MKNTDLVTVGFAAIVGAIVGYFIFSSIMGEPQNQKVTYKTVTTVSTELSEPDSEIFNDEAINPTVEVYVGTCKDLDNDGILSEYELEQCEQ